MRWPSGSEGEPVLTVPDASVMPKLPTCTAPGIAFMIGSATPGGCTAKLEFINRMWVRSRLAKSGW
jgi:hypothetical protein